MTFSVFDFFRVGLKDPLTTLDATEDPLDFPVNLPEC
jgi:hypothetical protein